MVIKLNLKDEEVVVCMEHKKLLKTQDQLIKHLKEEHKDEFTFED